MKYRLRAFRAFTKQLLEMSDEMAKVVDSKVKLIESNPFRFKSLSSEIFRHVFRVRISLVSKEKRLVYIVLKDEIILVCLLDRKHKYKDLKPYLKKLKEQLKVEGKL